MSSWQSAPVKRPASPLRRAVQAGFYLISAALVAAIAWGLSYIVREGGGSLPVLRQAPNFTAENVDGRKVSMSDLQGKIVLVTWFYTHCPNVCPLTMYRFEQIQDRLRQQGTLGKQVVLVAITLDPERDTLPVIRQYAQHFHADLSAWYFLRCNPQRTAAMLRAWGIDVQRAGSSGVTGHTAQADLVDENGNIRAEYITTNLNTSQVVSDIHSLIQRMNWGL